MRMEDFKLEITQAKWMSEDSVLYFSFFSKIIMTRVLFLFNYAHLLNKKFQPSNDFL